MPEENNRRNAGSAWAEITTQREHSLDGVRTLQERYKRFKGRCFLVSSNPSFTKARMPSESTDGVGRLPFDLFLLAVSAQNRLELAKHIQLGCPSIAA
jgi:hypothetical protein